MKTANNKKTVEVFVESINEFSINDIKAACPLVPMTSIYYSIHSLIEEGVVFPVGKGRYSRIPKVRYVPSITPWMKEIHYYMLEECVGVHSCICEHEGNLKIDVAKTDIPGVVDALKRHYDNVIIKKDADRFPAKLKGYLIVGQIISDSPQILVEDKISVPSIEKQLVDAIGRKGSSDKELDRLFQQAFEQYSINRNRLTRYASRRGLREELDEQLTKLDKARLDMFEKLQAYLSTIPISKAWVFGSFARGEETPSSDIDLLVSYDDYAKISLLNVVRYKLDIEKLTNRKIDLVEDGFLRGFALESANRDKYIIYERTS